MSFFSNTANSGQTGAGSLFGGNTGAGSTAGTSNLFGNTVNELTANKPANSIFGGSSTPNTSSGNSLFGGGSGTTAPASGSLFGGSNSNTSAPTAPSSNTPSTMNPLFGGGAFSLPKPTDQANKDAPKPATSSFFNNPASSSTGTSTPTSNTGLFGTTPKPAEGGASNTAASAAASTNTPGTGLFGGGLFGKPLATTPPAAAASTPASFSLGGGTPTTTAPAAPTTITTATSGSGLFGAKPTENNDKTPATSSALGTGNPFGSKPEDKKDSAASTALLKPGDRPGTSALGSSTAPAVAVQPPSVLRGKTIEEIVNKWSNELETHVKEFNRFAAEVSMWDRALIENSKSLAILYSHVQAAEREQAEVDQSLDHIEQQQKDLAATLDAYEKVTEEIFGGQGGSLRALDTGPADTERDKNYMLATDLQTHLDDLSGSLTQMIDAVNGLSMPSSGEKTQEDPMTQISQILSSHLDSLQWIDGSVREIESKVTEVERRVNESGQSLNGNGSKSRGFRG
ncbi:hypothetical protein GYMLUDRAFT_239927 [Collybiopsis luxurians FD-317 M1]|nr:hypothetical protein GYMLUDRAFT_239927 [Collybiopsis luxurians FD-317 M1]